MGLTVEQVVLELKTDNAQIKKGLDEVVAQLKRAKTQAKDTSGGFGVLEGQWTKLVSAFSASALIDKALAGIASFGQSAIDSAGKIVDLSDATGLSTRAVQLYGAVARQTGGDLNTYANSIFKLGVNLSNGAKDVRAGVQELGLSYQQLREESPEQQFEDIAAKLKLVANEGDRNRLGVLLFGKTWKDVAPGVVAGIEDIKNATVIASDAQVRAVDAAADAWDQFLENSKNATVSFLGDLVLALDKKKGALALLFQLFNGVPISIAAGTAAEINMADAGGPAKPYGPVLPRKFLVGSDHLTDEEKERLKKFQDAVQALADELSDTKLAEEMAKVEAAIKKIGGASKVAADQLPDLVTKIEKFRAAGMKVPPVFQQIVARANEVARAEMVLFGSDTRRRAEDFVKTLHVWSFNLEHDADVLRGIQASVDGLADTGRRLPFFDLPDRGNGLLGGQLPFGESVRLETPTIWNDETLRKRFVADLHTINGELSVGAQLTQQLGRNGGAAWRVINIGIDLAIQGANDYATAVENGANAQEAMAAAASGIATMGFSLALDWVMRMDQEQENLQHRLQATANQIRQYNGIAPGVDLNDRRFGNNGLRDDLAAANNYLEQLRRNSEAVRAPLGQLQDLLSNGWGVLPEVLSGVAASIGTLPGLTDDERQAIQRLIGQPSWEVEQQRAEQYGISLASLGTSFNQSRLNDSFDSLHTDFEMFRQGGADMNAVIAGMGPHIQDVVNQSRQFGTLIPEYMRPMLQAMADAGTLLDENGNALHDLSTFHFSASIESSFTRMADLLEQIVGLLGGAGLGARDIVNRLQGTTSGGGVGVAGKEKPGVGPREPGAGRGLLDAGRASEAALSASQQIADMAGQAVDQRIRASLNQGSLLQYQPREQIVIKQYSGTAPIYIAGRKVVDVVIPDLLDHFEQNASEGRAVGDTQRLVNIIERHPRA